MLRRRYGSGGVVRWWRQSCGKAIEAALELSNCDKDDLIIKQLLNLWVFTRDKSRVKTGGCNRHLLVVTVVH